MTSDKPEELFLEKLMERYLKGDTQVCGQLLSCPEYQQIVKRIARKHTRGTAVSWEDAAQTAHEKVLQVAQAGKFRQGGEREFYHWAATVARFKIIDLVRREKQENWISLNQNLPGTDLPLLDTIPDEFNLLDAVERTDLVLKAIQAIAAIEQRYPKKGYHKLWRGKVEGKTQIQLAADLGVTQGEISKRWKELLGRIAEELGLLSDEDVKLQLQTTQQHKAVRKRSDLRW